MNKGKVLLARPNSFIIKHMKRLVEESGHLPIPVSKIEEIESVNSSELKAVVISTSVSSVVEETYFEVFNIIQDKFPQKPVFLASLTEVAAVKRAFIQNGQTKHLVLQSIDEAQKDPIENAILVIRKADLIDESQFSTTLQVLNRKIA